MKTNSERAKSVAVMVTMLAAVAAGIILAHAVQCTGRQVTAIGLAAGAMGLIIGAALWS